MAARFPRDQWPDLEQKLGFIPMFPVRYEGNQSASLMGGWQMSIPTTSRNKDLAWELITIILEPKIFTPLNQKYGYLPTQIPIGDRKSTRLNSSHANIS